MVTRDEPLKDVVWKLVNTQKMGHRRWEGHRLHLSTVRHESPLHWIIKNKDVLESQDADLEMSQGSYVPKNLSTRRTMPLKWSKILRNPSKSFEILQISIVCEFVVTSNYYHFLDPPNLQILWQKFGNPGADRILAAPGFTNFGGFPGSWALNQIW